MSMHVWRPGYLQGGPDPRRCRAAVASDSRAPIFHQCLRKVAVWRSVDGEKGKIGFCSQHDPERRAQRDAKAAQARKAAEGEDNRRHTEGQRRAKALGGGSPHYQPGWGGQLGRYTGGIVLTAEQADALIARLARENR